MTLLWAQGKRVKNLTTRNVVQHTGDYVNVRQVRSPGGLRCAHALLLSSGWRHMLTHASARSSCPTHMATGDLRGAPAATRAPLHAVRVYVRCRCRSPCRRVALVLAAHPSCVCVCAYSYHPGQHAGFRITAYTDRRLVGLGRGNRLKWMNPDDVTAA